MAWKPHISITDSLIPPPLLNQNSFIEEDIIPSKIHTHPGSIVQFSTISIRSIMCDFFERIPSEMDSSDKADKRLAIAKRLCGEDFTSQKIRVGITSKHEETTSSSEDAVFRANNSQAMIKRIADVYAMFHGDGTLLAPEDYNDLKEAYDITS